ncbi:MAG: MBL fold metallo-hydrolase [Flavobacteriaceae bacterium]
MSRQIRLRNFRSIINGALTLFVAFTLIYCSKTEDHEPLSIQIHHDRQQDFSLWQLGAFFEEVQMGYLIRTDEGNIIVIDGGGIVSAPILKSYVKQLGGRVHTWIITHPHTDHMNALLEILNDKAIGIDRILHVALEDAWVFENEKVSYDTYKRYVDVLETSNVPKIDVVQGDRFMLGDGINLEVLGTGNPDIEVNAINNSSMVFKISSKSKSILFLGDLGDLGGNALLNSKAIDKLKSDYVQMAHHGQRGVSKEFYAAVNAKYALWPTPKWLWNNQLAGKAEGSGTWKTMEVRAWMNELNIQKNYVSGLIGTVQID